MFLYDGENARLIADITTGADLRIDIPNPQTAGTGIGTVTRFPLGSYIQIGGEIMRITSSSLTGTSLDTISVVRGALGTLRQNHFANDLVKKVKPIPVEFRRPSIIRASGHTFEYVGYGPGNYSTGLPQVQVRTLSEREEFLVQSQEKSCGTVVYTGMNNRGDFFIGNKRVSSATGQERTFDAPVPTVTGEDPSRLSVIFDEVVVKERLIVEGGRTNKILSQFDGPVTFNKEVKVNNDLTVTGLLKLASDLEVTSETQSINKDTGCVVLEGGLGVEKNLNVGGMTTITSALNVTNGSIVLEAGSANEGYRIDSAGTIAMSLHRSTVSGLPIVLDVEDGKRLILGANGTGRVEIVDSVNGVNRALFTENQQQLFWNGNEKFRTENSGVSISGITTTTDLSVTGVSTFAGLLDLGSSADIDSDADATFDGWVAVGSTVTIDSNLRAHGWLAIGSTANLGGNTSVHGWLAVGSTATFADNVTAPLFIGDLQGNADTATNLSGNPNLNTSGIITCSVLHATNTGNHAGRFVGTGVTVAGHLWLQDDLRVNGVTTCTQRVHLLDDDVLHFGGTVGQTGDFQLQHTGNDAIINNTTGDLFIRAGASDDINIQDTGGNMSAEFNLNAGVRLFWRGGSNSGEKFKTEQGGCEVTGELQVTADIVAFVSDERLKTNKVGITNALDKVASLSGFTYNFNETASELGYDTEERHVGVSAQEVEKVLPEAVVPAAVDENYKTVKYDKIVPLLIEAIKELKAEVEELKKHTH